MIFARALSLTEPRRRIFVKAVRGRCQQLRWAAFVLLLGLFRSGSGRARRSWRGIVARSWHRFCDMAKTRRTTSGGRGPAAPGRSRSGGCGMAAAERRSRGGAGRTAAIGITLGLGLTVAFNVVALVVAIRTDPGLVTDDYYQRSLQPDPEDGRRARFAALGWHADLAGPLPDGSFVFRLGDRGGKPVSGRSVTAVFYRTTRSALDRQAVAEEVAPGRYRARPDRLAPGHYEARLRISGPGEDLSWQRRVRVLD